MPARFAAPSAVLVLAAVVVGVGTAQQPKSIYRDGFAGRTPMFARGDANIKFEEKDHKLSGEHGKSGLTSEYIKVEANPPGGATEAEYVHYHYEVPPAPVTDRLTAQVWVKAFRPGPQVKARVVFPKERDPKNPDALLTALVAGAAYDRVRTWQPLGFGNVEDAVRKQLPVLHARLGRAVDPSGAYIDRVVLNVYAGPGVTEVWIDDLEIGPVRTDVEPPRAPGTRAPGDTVGRPKVANPRSVEFADGRIVVDDQPFFMLGVRHTGSSLKQLRDARFNTVWFPTDAPQPVVEEAIRHGFWIVPTLPLPAGEWDGRKPKAADPAALDKDATVLTEYLRKYLAGDAVLMWDLGGGRTLEDLPRVRRAAELLRVWDPRRPRAVDLWDGYTAYSTYVDAVGAHRWPLFSSLELTQYREWLTQRKALVAPGKMTWTWVQNHMPEWLVGQLTGRPDATAFDFPVGPHPEQIRLLTYLSLAAGHRGLGYWSDKFFENPCRGRDRLLEMALLNTEIEMLKPVLFAAQDPARWVPSVTHPGTVQAAIIRGPREILVLPVWLETGSQYTPAQGSAGTVTIRIPLVPDGTNPWLVTPVGATQLTGVRRVAGGTEVDIPEFDTTAAIVFTSDLGPKGKVVRWQDHGRAVAPVMARYAQQQAIEQFNKAWETHHAILAAGGPDLPNGEAADLFRRARESIVRAKGYADNNQPEIAYRESRKALQPLRVLMRGHWQKATETLDVPSASPFAVSFYTLPQHWALAREVAPPARPAGNGFPNGGFELSKPAPDGGAKVSSLPGWEVRTLILDRNVTGAAAIINADQDGVADKPPEPPVIPTTRYAPLRVAPQPIDFRQPEFGRHVLTMRVDFAGETDAEGKAVEPTQALERAVVAVDSPPAEFAPGTLVRVSFWVKVPGSILSSADGLVVFDSAGGEPLGVRVQQTVGWKKYHLYRRVPASGKVAMTFALTGFGVALIDDVRIEPIVPGATAAHAGPAAVHPVGFRK